jgi:hypothetical protein
VIDRALATIGAARVSAHYVKVVSLCADALAEKEL